MKELYRVTLGHRVVPILETSTLVEEEAVGMFTSGDDGEMQILISPDLSPKLKASTIFHELLHAIEHVYGIELEERGVLLLEAVLGDFLHANSEFTQGLIEQFLGTFTVSSRVLDDPMEHSDGSVSHAIREETLKEAIKISRKPHFKIDCVGMPGSLEQDCKIEEKVRLSGKYNTGYNDA